MSYTDPINFDFTGKIAIVTGAASGIGRLTAERFAEMGASIVLTDINQAGIDEVTSGIIDKGGNAIAVAADIRKFDEVSEVRNKAMETYGRIDFLINCAGGASGRINKVKESFRDWPIEALDWGIDVNLKGPMYLTRACIGDMIDGGRGGVILYLGQQAGIEEHLAALGGGQVQHQLREGQGHPEEEQQGAVVGLLLGLLGLPDLLGLLHLFGLLDRLFDGLGLFHGLALGPGGMGLIRRMSLLPGGLGFPGRLGLFHRPGLLGVGGLAAGLGGLLFGGRCALGLPGRLAVRFGISGHGHGLDSANFLHYRPVLRQFQGLWEN